MSEPRIVTPKEAQTVISEGATELFRADALLYTVATEPDRIRAAAEKAWQQAVEWFALQGPRVPILLLLNAEEENPYSAEAIENGADQ